MPTLEQQNTNIFGRCRRGLGGREAKTSGRRVREPWRRPITDRGGTSRDPFVTTPSPEASLRDGQDSTLPSRLECGQDLRYLIFKITSGESNSTLS